MNLYGVFRTWPSGDPVLAAIVMRAQREAAVAVDDGHIGEAADTLGVGFDAQRQSDRCKQEAASFIRTPVRFMQTLKRSRSEKRVNLPAYVKTDRVSIK